MKSIIIFHDESDTEKGIEHPGPSLLLSLAGALTMQSTCFDR